MRTGVCSKRNAGDVGEGELAEVAQPLGHQEGDDRPADQEADRVDQAVEAADHHRGRDAEEGCRRHVVAGDRQAVLEAGDAAAGGVEVGRRLGLGGGPLGDEQRADDEDGEHADGGPVGRLLLQPGRDRRRRPWPRRRRRAGAIAPGALASVRSAHFSAAFDDLRRSARRTRRWRDARRSPVITIVNTMTAEPDRHADRRDAVAESAAPGTACRTRPAG